MNTATAALPLLRDQPRVIDRLHQQAFNALYSRALVYNTCWEDPAVDRQALHIGPDDVMLVISSAGCNVLDYALCGPAQIYAVDANPRQTALLELKIAAIRALPHADFFELFGRGYHPRYRDLYRDALRSQLSPFARDYWDQRGSWFASAHPRRRFYFRGLAGQVAGGFHTYLALRPQLRAGIQAAVAAPDLSTQRAIYDEQIEPLMWSKAMRWVLSRQATMSMLGVPYPQTREVEQENIAGVAGYIRDAVRYVFRELPLADNYFWRLYLQGEYTPDCCPEYLQPAGFAKLKAGLVDRIQPNTTTVTRFLQRTPKRISRFVLLDHMDWMSTYHPEALVEEWQAILTKASPGARLISRSASARPGYLESLRVPLGGKPQALADCLTFEPELAAALQPQDRVHTYAGFHIATLK